MGSTEERSRLIESISILERELKEAERELAKAVQDRLRTTQIEDQWHVEVSSLSKLIEVRQQRLNPDSNAQVASSIAGVTRAGSDQSSGGVPQVSFSSEGEGGGEKINLVEWIEGFVAASGSRGIAPPEILAAAAKAGLKMHKNYPYVVLKKLKERDHVIRRGKRYFKKQQS